MKRSEKRMIDEMVRRTNFDLGRIGFEREKREVETSSDSVKPRQMDSCSWRTGRLTNP